MKEWIMKLMAREFIVLMYIEVAITFHDVKLLLSTENISLIGSLLTLTAVKKVIDKKYSTTPTPIEAKAEKLMEKIE